MTPLISRAVYSAPELMGQATLVFYLNASVTKAKKPPHVNSRKTSPINFRVSTAHRTFHLSRNLKFSQFDSYGNAFFPHISVVHGAL
jgi:hypothetical protein